MKSILALLTCAALPALPAGAATDDFDRGSARAQEKGCLECHANAREGDLLGAFTYYLDTPVDRLDANRVRE